MFLENVREKIGLAGAARGVPGWEDHACLTGGTCGCTLKVIKAVSYYNIL